jgi:uncharacterized protein GlcG (DUF336 family)
MTLTRALAAGLLAMAALLPGARSQAQNLTVAEVQQIIAAAAVEANARGRVATIAVVDRVGNVLGVFDMNAGLTQLTVTTKKSIPVGNGLEQVQATFTGAGAANSPSTRLSAITKAITGAYLSSSGNAFTTRTASQIVQEHFNPGEFFAPSGPLFGVQFSQLPCSDFSVRQASNAGAPTGLINATVGPKRSPLGLSADPGGFPLYKGGSVVGGIGVESDRIYTIDPQVRNYDSDPDEIIALAGQFNFRPPEDIRAHRIFVDGKSLRYSDATDNAIATNPANASFAAVNGVLGNLVAVTGYAAAATIAGQTYGTIASGVAPDNTGAFDFVGKTVFIFFNGGGAARFPPTASTTPATGAGGLTANEVTTIIGNALKVAFAARAQIRRPLGRSFAQVTVSVVDADGNILGMARTPDAPIFGADVSLQKARTGAFFSNPGAAAYLGTFNSAVLTATAGDNANGVVLSSYLTEMQGFLGGGSLANGIAFSDRSIGNLARPFFPDGIDRAPRGPLSRNFPVWSPFNVGFQLDAVLDNFVEHILYADGTGGTDTVATCSDFQAFAGTMLTRISNGVQIFPGGFPIYRNGTIIGGIGISGDGIDQDDMIGFLGLEHAASGLGTGFGNAPIGRRADNLAPQGSNLRYVNCPFSPFLNSRLRNVCQGK